MQEVETKPEVSPRTRLAEELLAGAGAVHEAVADALASFHAPKPKPERKCALPGCEVMTRHNGGYCCAQHCRDHAGRQKGKV